MSNAAEIARESCSDSECAKIIHILEFKIETSESQKFFFLYSQFWKLWMFLKIFSYVFVYFWNFFCFFFYMCPTMLETKTLNIKVCIQTFMKNQKIRKNVKFNNEIVFDQFFWSTLIHFLGECLRELCILQKITFPRIFRKFAINIDMETLKIEGVNWKFQRKILEYTLIWGITPSKQYIYQKPLNNCKTNLLKFSFFFCISIYTNIRFLNGENNVHCLFIF